MPSRFFRLLLVVSVGVAAGGCGPVREGPELRFEVTLYAPKFYQGFPMNAGSVSQTHP